MFALDQLNRVGCPFIAPQANGDGLESVNRNDDGVLEAARAIRPYLSDLLGPAKAVAIDRQIADALTVGSAGTTAADQVRMILERDGDTTWFLQRVLDDKPLYRPPYYQPVITRGITAPAGDPGFVAADRYACPQGDYVWYRPDVGTSVPQCPDHDILLVRA
jgi:hypothetical protein